MKRLICLAAVWALTGLGQAFAQPIVTSAPHALLIDATSGAVLLQKAADTPMAPSSMGKMMTVYTVFEMIKKGEVKLTDKLPVSAGAWSAWNNRGSSMFLAVNEQVSVEDLLHGIVTLSGNDACVVLAEGLAGTEAAFVARMNRTAARLGLKGSRFANTTGWPDPNEYVTARDLAMLAERTIRDFPDLYAKFYPIPSYTRKLTGEGKTISQPNRNPILGRVQGADGLKTGHTEIAGYGFTGSAARDGRRLILVVNGLGSMAERQAESIRLLEWGFRAFEMTTIAKAGQVIGQAPVWRGAQGAAPLAAARDVRITLPRGVKGEMTRRIVMQGPVPAPVAKGQTVAHLVVSAPGMAEQRIPLVAADAVAEAGFFKRAFASLKYLLSGG